MANFKKNKKGRSFKRRCELCELRVEYVDYKNVDFISKFINGVGQIKARSNSGSCAKHQRKIANAIKRARFMALIPYTMERIRVLSAPSSAVKKESAPKKAA
ncbi:30S ribosomal protein S18 [Mycoplasma tauri]|uniref:30S ribosomal protein S18 n=1 Tax=Mycoplasma tauri TaxID=547987 RepID=UPI001CBF0026|nr:30S ribosomal protein S18 [Mycoplasma tauri]MBZ4203653.1 30S ribosomal protein S18 [Mycoplasma tauri]